MECGSGLTQPQLDKGPPKEVVVKSPNDQTKTQVVWMDAFWLYLFEENDAPPPLSPHKSYAFAAINSC
jgi:hypothetical protein